MKTDTSKSTVLIISMGFLALYLIFLWHWAIIVSLTVGVVGILSSFLGKKIEWGWMKLAQLLGYIIPNILLGIIFYFFLFPISVLSRFFGEKDPLQLKNQRQSMFIICDKNFTKESLEKTW